MRYHTTRKTLTTTAALLGAACLLPGLAAAQVKGQCADCHTMHNSQDGAFMNSDATVYRALTRGDCVGCHTNTTDGAGRGGTTDNIPYVNHTNAPSLAAEGILAGGSFYWVQTDDAKGHNVNGITAAADATLGNTPPGYNAFYDGQGYNDASRLTCAGTNGCHGDRSETDDYAALSGAHHGAQASAFADGTNIANSYRFLNGIKGLESADWESLQTFATRNVYYGVDRANDQVVNDATISSLCGQCHGNFHASQNAHDDDGAGISMGNDMASPWVRHPTDFDMYKVRTGEYGSYLGQMEAPVASANVDGAYVRLAAADIVTTEGEAIVTCISCHRAHGTANDDLLRWDYADMTAHEGGAPGTGCFRCHTTKDAS